MPTPITGLDVTLRRLLTYVAVCASVGLAAVAVTRAATGQMPGAAGAVLVLVVVAAVGVKFAAETYSLSYLGVDDGSLRERVAQRMVGQYAGLMKLRFALGALGGVVLPLSVQALAAGLKDFIPVTNPMIPALTACVAAAFLLPGELIERRLWRLATKEAGAEAPSV